MGKRNRLVYDPFVLMTHVVVDDPARNVLIRLDDEEDAKMLASLSAQACKIDLLSRGIVVAVLNQSYAGDQSANDELGDLLGGLTLESYSAVKNLYPVRSIYVLQNDGAFPKPVVPPMKSIVGSSAHYLRTFCFPACLIGKRRDMDDLPDDGLVEALFENEKGISPITDFLVRKVSIEKDRLFGPVFVTDEFVAEATFELQDLVCRNGITLN